MILDWEQLMAFLEFKNFFSSNGYNINIKSTKKVEQKKTKTYESHTDNSIYRKKVKDSRYM